MVSFKSKTLATCIAVTSIAVFCTAAQAASDTRTWESSCTAGNFTGLAGGTTWVDAAQNTVIQTSWYKITRSNNQSGGNKANLKTRFVNLTSGIGYAGAFSGDNLIQDGVRHDISLANFSLHTPGIKIISEFIFDKSGGDPRCNLNYSIQN